MNTCLNSVTLCGTLGTLPAYSHENHGRRFYRFTLEVPRLSGATDALPVVAAEDVLERMDLDGGENLTVMGQIRTFNNRTGEGRRLIVSVFASEIIAENAEPENKVELTGIICKTPVYRRTPLGREICDVMLAVNRRYHRADYVPCILWGRTAQETAAFPVGTRLELHGRLQSRTYMKLTDLGSEERVTYEMSVMEAYLLPEEET